MGSGEGVGFSGMWVSGREREEKRRVSFESGVDSDEGDRNDKEDVRLIDGWDFSGWGVGRRWRQEVLLFLDPARLGDIVFEVRTGV